MIADTTSSTTRRPIHEVVGVFPNANALDTAVHRLKAAGFPMASLSVLGTDDEVKARIGHLYHSVTEIEDDARAPRSHFVSGEARLASEMTTVAIPLYIGGLLGAAAVAASGGALAAAIAALIVGSASGGSIGGLIAEAVARHHANRIEEQVAQGGLVLWVQVADQSGADRAMAELREAKARDLHVHTVRRSSVRARAVTDERRG